MSSYSRYWLTVLAIVWAVWSAAVWAQAEGTSADDEIEAEFNKELVQRRAEARILAVQPEMTFEFHEYATPEGGDAQANGIITERTYDDLVAFIDKVERAGSRVNNITFNSVGGNLGVAIRIGEFLRQKQISTLIDIASQCKSACAVAFLGGRYRTVDNQQSWRSDERDEQESLGFHSFDLSQEVRTALRPDEATEFARGISQDAQTTLGDLARYISSMGADPQIIQLAAPYGPNDFLFPTMSSLRSFGIVTGNEDGGDFRLIPDGGSALAVYFEEDRQLIIGCDVTDGGGIPVVVLGTKVRENFQAPIIGWQAPVKLSAILQSKALPWSARDKEHRHFHADAWLPGAAYKVFALLSISSDATGDEDAQVVLSDENARFFVGDGAFYVVVQLPLDLAKPLASSNSGGLRLMEEESVPTDFRFSFDNSPQDLETISFALRGCT